MVAKVSTPPLLSTLDLERFRETPLTHDPYDYLVVPGFILEFARESVNADYPAVSRSGSFPLSEVRYGPAFAKLIEELNSEPFRKAFEEKFEISLEGRPTMTTVRGQCSQKDGRIHTDSATKIITVLIYMNNSWEESGGQLRVLRSGTDLEDFAAEVPPLEGTLLAFRRSGNSWHGHKPFAGPRRVIQFNWVLDEGVVAREQRRHRFSAWIKKLFRSKKA